MSKLDQVTKLLPTLPQLYYRLILIVGSQGTGKTRLLKQLSQQQHLPYLNLNLQLSQRLLEVPSPQRPLRVRPEGAALIADQPEPVLVLDNIELLFDPTLHQDPLALLKELSRNKSLLVTWGGTYNEERHLLIYAEPGHPEYRRYDRPDVPIITG